MNTGPRSRLFKTTWKGQSTRKMNTARNAEGTSESNNNCRRARNEISFKAPTTGLPFHISKDVSEAPAQVVKDASWTRSRVWWTWMTFEIRNPNTNSLTAVKADQTIKIQTKRKTEIEYLYYKKQLPAISCKLNNEQNVRRWQDRGRSASRIFYKN